MSEGCLLPAIPAKRYFTIGEVAQLCCVKPHVLRYWEQEFTQLRPVKRRGNRRYYQHHELLMIRRIRELLYEQGFTIQGARNRLRETGGGAGAPEVEEVEFLPVDWTTAETPDGNAAVVQADAGSVDSRAVRQELLQIRELLSL